MSARSTRSWRIYARTLVPVLWLLALPLLIRPSVLRGTAGLGPERLFDTDSLFGVVSHVSVRPYDDATPAVIEYPRDVYLAQRARSGHLDLWGPLQGFGVPHLADQAGVMFPLRLLYYAAPSHASHVLFRVLRLVIAGLGAYWLARRRGLSTLPALTAATLFEACGGLCAQLPFVSAGPVVLLPWLLLGLEELRAERRRAGLVTLAFSLALTVSAGHAVIAAIVLLGGAAYALGMGWKDKQRALRWAPLAGAACLLAGLIAASTIGSFLELLQNGHSYKHSVSGLNTWRMWLHATRLNSFVGYGGAFLVDGLVDENRALGFPYTIHMTFGVTTAMLAFAALCRRRWDAPMVAMFLTGIFLSYDPPGREWVQHLPLLRDMLPRYLWPLVVFPLTQWAGSGVQVLQRLAVRVARSRPSHRRPPQLRPFPKTLALGCAGALGIWCITAAMLLTGALLSPRGQANGTVAHSLAHPVRLMLPLIFMGLAAIGAYGIGRRRPRLVGPWVAATAVVELVASLGPFLVFPASIAQQSPIPEPARQLAELTRQSHTRIGSMGNGFSMPQIPMLAGIADARMISPLVPRRFAAYLATAGAATTWTYFSLPVVSSPFGDLAAIRYVLAEKSSAATLPGDPRQVRLFDTFGASVYENQSSLSRFRLVHRAIHAADITQAAKLLKQLVAGKNHVEDTPLSQAVILESATPDGAALATDGAPAEDVDVVRDDPDELILRTHSAQPGWAVIADVFYPGWEAEVDGQKRPIYAANVGFRAVAVSAGEHTVSLRYRPTSAWLGFPLAGLGLLALAVLILSIHTSRRNTSSTAQPADSAGVSSPPASEPRG